MTIVGKHSHYPFDLDLVNRVCESIRVHQRANKGKKPGGLLLGYGTYLVLCETVSEFRYRDFPYASVEYTNHFEGIPIEISDYWEFIISTKDGCVIRPEHELLFKALNLYVDAIRRFQTDAVNDQ